MRSFNVIASGLLIMLGALVMGGACNKENTSTDPLKDKAREYYAEGRRLFLTCDPNKYDEAHDDFEKAISHWEDYPEAQAAWAENISMWYGSLIPEELFQAGYMKAQRAIRLDPNLDMGYRAMADLFRHHRDPDTGKFQDDLALEVIDRALAISPDSAENLYVKGSIYVTSDPMKAVELLNQAKKANPNLGKIYFNLAAAHQTLADRLRTKYRDEPDKLKEHEDEIGNNYKIAEKYLETYQRLVPGDLAGFASMGVILQRQGRTEDAEKMFQKAATSNMSPDQSQIRWRILAYIELSKIAENRQDLKTALFYMERALEPAPRNTETLYHLVRLNQLAGNDQAAEEYHARLKESLDSRRRPPQKPPEGDIEEGDTTTLDH